MQHVESFRVGRVTRRWIKSEAAGVTLGCCGQGGHGKIRTQQDTTFQEADFVFGKQSYQKRNFHLHYSDVSASAARGDMKHHVLAPNVPCSVNT